MEAKSALSFPRTREEPSQPLFSSYNNYKSLDETPRLQREGRSEAAEQEAACASAYCLDWLFAFTARLLADHCKGWQPGQGAGPFGQSKRRKQVARIMHRQHWCIAVDGRISTRSGPTTGALRPAGTPARDCFVLLFDCGEAA